jgi:hypothetical protein
MNPTRGLLSCLLVVLSVVVPLRAEAQLEPGTYRLTQSTAAYDIWTCPPGVKVFRNDAVPYVEQSQVQVHAARNEFEPFLVVVKPTGSGNVTVSIGDFGAGITQLMYEVKYVTVTLATDMRGGTGEYPDPLWPLESGDTVSLTAGQNTALWITVQVPAGTPAGDYSTDVTVDGIAVPIALHVFDFELPGELSVASSLGFSQQQVLAKYGAGFSDWAFMDQWRQFFIDHRLTPQVPLWPSALTTGGGTPLVSYNCATQTLSDPDGIWGFEMPAARWLGGTGLLGGNFTDPFNDGVGFPSYPALGLGSNDPSEDPRPSSMCGEIRGAGDWYTANDPASAYNLMWSGYVGALGDYLAGLGYLDKSYFFMANEPSDQADYDAIAWYSRQLKAAAPGLRLMVSEEPKPAIFNHPDYVQDAQVDIWLTYLGFFDPAVAAERDAAHGESSWLYYLPSSVAPYSNPFTLDHPGVDSRLMGWFFWKYRLRGLMHDSIIDWSINPWTTPAPTANNGFTNLLYPPSPTNTAIAYGSNNQRPVPSIRMELIRDGFEDYEYLRVMNAAAAPAAGVTSAADAQVDKVIGGVASYTQDADFIANLRRLIGQLNAGEITSLPDIHPVPVHQRAMGAPGDYYLNFQNLAGEPTADPLVVDGKTYLKIDGADYSAGAGYGWYSPPSVNWAYGWVPAGPNELQNSILYSDYGRPAVFEFDLPAGTYDVTVSAGWPGLSFDHGKIVIEGVPLLDDETTTDNIVRTASITVLDSKLTMEMGIHDYYTMLNYLDIEAQVPSGVDNDTPRSGTRHLLHHAVPNPFNPATRLAFTLAGNAEAALRVYDLAGRLVKTLLDEAPLEAGRHEVTWDGTDDRGRAVAAGMYLYRLQAGAFSETKMVALVK